MRDKLKAMAMLLCYLWGSNTSSALENRSPSPDAEVIANVVSVQLGKDWLECSVFWGMEAVLLEQEGNDQNARINKTDSEAALTVGAIMLLRNGLNEKEINSYYQTQVDGMWDAPVRMVREKYRRLCVIIKEDMQLRATEIMEELIE